MLCINTRLLMTLKIIYSPAIRDDVRIISGCRQKTRRTLGPTCCTDLTVGGVTFSRVCFLLYYTTEVIFMRRGRWFSNQSWFYAEVFSDTFFLNLKQGGFFKVQNQGQTQKWQVGIELSRHSCQTNMEVEWGEIKIELRIGGIVLKHDKLQTSW